MSKLTVINDMSEIPEFKTEQEEVAFWDTHTLAAHLYTQKAQAEAEALLPPPRASNRSKSRPTSIRLGHDLEQRLRVLAEKKGMSYQTLLKDFVLERTYEEEKRLKII